MKHVTFKETPQTVSPNSYWEDEVVVEQVAHLEHCENCDGLTLSRYMWVDGYTDPADVAPVRVFPDERSVADLPERVREHYAGMLEIRHAPDLFVVRAGKVLEAVCAEQGISRNVGGLEDRLDKLVEREAVPQALVDQAHLVRKYRNIGGHDNVVDVEDDDVLLLRGFVEALLSFLYWGPRELERASAALERRREEAKARRE